MSIYLLPNAITISNVSDMQASFMQLDMMQPSFSMDASQTEMMTTAGVQLIIALANTLKNAGSKLIIIKQTDYFKQAFLKLGISNGSFSDE